MTPEQVAIDRINMVASTGGDTLELGDLPLKSLPEEIFALKTLRVLILGAGKYDETHGVSMMRKMKGAAAHPLIKLTGLDRLTSLRHLDLSKLACLTAIPEVNSLKFLRSLNLSGCTSLTALPELRNLTELKSLSLPGLTSVTALPELESLTQLTWLSLQGLTSVTALPELESLTQLTWLSLQGFTSLTALPDLGKLTALTSLSLHGLTSLTALPDLGKLTQLTSLSLQGFTSLTALPDLGKLTQLTSLGLYNFSSVTALPELESLTQLTWLSLHGFTSLTALPDLGKLTQLTSLSLHGFTSLTALPDLGKLTQLTSLGLYNFSSVTALPELESLTQLTSLSLHGFTSLTALPDLGKLTQLTSLSLHGFTSLTALPDLGKLTALTSLSLQGLTSLTALPGLEMLVKLIRANFSGSTGLMSLPGLASLRALTSLRLQGCRNLGSLPDFGNGGSLALIDVQGCGLLGSFAPIQRLLDKLSELYLYGTYFDDLPAELCGSFADDNILHAVLAHLTARTQQGDHEDRECKVLILGNGRVGKTSLAKQLLGLRHDPNEKSTHGIRLWTWEPKIQLQDDSESESIRINIWDFGGQDIYHNTHRLFISSRAVFVLAWDATSSSRDSSEVDGDILDKKRPLTYWLDQVHSIHPNPQIIIVRTKIDLACAVETDWRYGVPEKYRNIPSIEVSSADRTTLGTENMQRIITKAIGQELGKKTNRIIGDGRWRVKSRLRELQAANDLLMLDNKQPSHPTLTTDQFSAMVTQECANSDDASDPQYLLRYLHDTGVIYYRRDLVSGLVIVEQRWVIDNIYAIFNPGVCRDNLLQSRGRFRSSQLNQWAWSGKGFTEEVQRLIVWFMYSCRICFILLNAGESASGENVYVATYYLPKRHIVDDDITELLHPFGKEPIASMTAEHLFLGEGLMGGFLCRLGDLFSRSARFWKNGAAFVASQEKVAATVEWMPQEHSSFGGKLQIQTFGDATTAPDVMTQIWGTFRFQPGFPEGLRWTRDVWPAAPDLEFELVTENDDRQLEAPSRSDRIRPIIGISRASERDTSGNKYSEPGSGRLPALLHDALVRSSGSRIPCKVLIDDQEHEFSTIPLFMDELAKVDFVFVFLSKKYLHSKYCCYELMSIYKAHPIANPFPKDRVKLLRYPSGKLSDGSSKKELANYWKNEAQQFVAGLPEIEGDPLRLMDIAEQMDTCFRWIRFSKVESSRWELIGAIGKSPWYDLPQPSQDGPTDEEMELVKSWLMEVDKELAQRLTPVRRR